MTRRQALSTMGSGFGMLGLSGILGANELARNPLEVKPSHFAPKAKRVIFLFMNGGPSQVDTFDSKPALTKYHGTPYTGDAKVGSNGRAIGRLMQSPFEFQQHGNSGLPISSLFPHIAAHADDLCVIRSMHSDTA